MRKWLRKLWNGFKPVNQSSAEKESAEKERTEPFSQWYTYGNHMYRSAGEIAEVVFTTGTGEKKLIVDNNGYIMNFPGIEKEDFWMKEISNQFYLAPQIRFRTEFSKYDSKRYIMRWQVQPDGRYWEDEDGYGMTIDSEIILYAFIDREGEFMGPFRVYQVGCKGYLRKESI